LDFALSADQVSVREAVRDFARTELGPGYLARAKSPEFPWKQHRQVASLGVFGLLAGPEHNPLPAEDFVAAGLVAEELGYADFNLANAAIPVMLMSSLITHHGNPDVRARWLEPMIEGTALVGLGLTEPGAGSDVSSIRTTATVVGDEYVLSGEKTSVTMLAHAQALIVVAKTLRAGEHVGASAFVVPMDLPGITRSPIADPGWLPLGRGVLHLDGVRVPASARLGEEGSAFRSVLNGFDFTRPLLALTGLGCAQASVEETARGLRITPR
jgi:cyclohexanecarboxyl-CoA dehydrogenase